MTRLVLTILAVVLGPAAARATLVVIVPSASGLVVAADSRESIMGTECDGLFKIVQMRRPLHTVVMVTGDGIFVAPPSAPGSDATKTQDPCTYLKSAPRLLDVAAVVTDYLERDSAPWDKIRLDNLGARCVDAAHRLQMSHPGVLEGYAGRDIFSVVVAHYDPKSRNSTLLNFVVRFDSGSRAIVVDRTSKIEVGQHDRRGVWAFGEADYLNQNVYRGAGREFLTESTRKFILDSQPVAASARNESTASAVNIIEAASRTSGIVAPRSGIGGPIEVVFIDGRRRADSTSYPGAGSVPL